MSTFNIEWHWQVPYEESLIRQEYLRLQVCNGKPETIILAEHPPTITLGKRGGTIFNLPQGTVVHPINRGGLATWHGPGQLALYPIIQLSRYKIGVRSLACILETTTIDTLKQLGIEAARNVNSPGIWVGNQKIAALGLDVKKGVNIHGVALNISNDLSGFSSIEACGDSTVRYTSVEKVLQTPKCSLQDIGKLWLQYLLNALSDRARNKSCN